MILQLLGSRNYVIVNKDLIKMVGLHSALMLGELASEYSYWYDRGELVDGYFYSTTENLEENTGLSYHKQTEAIKNLKKLGVLDVKVKGVPAKRYFRINEKQVSQLFENKYLKNSNTGFEKIEELDVKKFEGNNNKKNNKKNNKEQATCEAIILITGAEWKPTIDEYEEMKRLHPSVDIEDEFRKMRSWSLNNPQRRKTRQGVKRFVNSWLDRATPAKTVVKNQFNDFEQRTDYDYADLAKRLQNK